jgi:hypothetical protein
MVPVQVTENVLLDEPARVQVGEVEVGELRAEAIAQVGLGPGISIRNRQALAEYVVAGLGVVQFDRGQVAVG